MFANFKPGHQDTWVDYTADRAPLLFIAGSEDHIMQLEPTPEGGFVIDALDLGPLLGIDAPRVPDGRATGPHWPGQRGRQGRLGPAR